MTESSKEDRFQWKIGQSLTPKDYSRLGKIWEVGKVWMSTATLAPAETAIAKSAASLSLKSAPASVPGGKKRQGLAKERDLLKKEGKVSARLFGDAFPVPAKKKL